MIHPATSEKLTSDEKHEVHNARIIEFESGAISGKEFVWSLFHQCGFTELDAKRQWHDVKDLGNVAIYKVGCGDTVYYPHGGDWKKGRVASFYATGVGAVVEIGDGLRVPFSLFELRVS